MIVNIDTMFVNYVPEELHDILIGMNRGGRLKMPRDHHSFLKIVKRFTIKKDRSVGGFFYAIGDMIICFVHTIIFNLFVVWFSYLGCLTVILL